MSKAVGHCHVVVDLETAKIHGVYKNRVQACIHAGKLKSKPENHMHYIAVLKQTVRGAWLIV